jgi:hypothetical protein
VTKPQSLKFEFKKSSQVFLALILVAFLLKGVVLLDPDFGWRLKAGEIFLSEGIPRTDPFSYTMTSFPWVDHAWFQSMMIAATYPVIGKVGLAFIYACIAAFSLIISLARNKRNVVDGSLSALRSSLDYELGLFGNLVFLLAVYAIFIFFGSRVQVVSWLMLAILLKVVLDPKIWEKWRLFLPAFFVLWVNLHGSFALGILVLFLVLVVRAIRLKNFVLEDIVIAIACVVVSLINPYGTGVWREVWSSASDLKLRFTINEWKPTLTMLNLPVAASIALFCVFVWKQKKSLE